jgi:hypothetical protein
MRGFLVLLAMVGCAGDGDGPHELGECDPVWNEGLSPTTYVQCERACVVPLTLDGPPCQRARCVDGNGRECHGNEDCVRTGTAPDGSLGCCQPTGTISGGLTVQFYECVD